MAVKPIINTIAPWDATVGKNITFSYSGNLPVYVSGVVKNASTLVTVWTGNLPVITDSSGRFTFYLPPNSFKANPTDVNGNGNKYCIQLTVYDNNGTPSSISDKAYFWCLATPEFSYVIPVNSDIITSASVLLQLHYYQENGEKLYTYKHFLYDNSRNLVETSKDFYNETGYEYSFKALENNTSYYLRTQGMTKKGMVVDTGYVHIFTNYYSSEDYSLLSVESDDNATVYGTTNMICIDANEDPDDYVYIDSYVQLIRRKITYETNYNIARDFTLQIKFTKLLYRGIMLKMYSKDNPDCIVTLDSYVFDDGTLRYCLKVFNGIATYVLYTDPMIVDNDQVMVVTIRRVDNHWNLMAELDLVEEV